MKTSMPRTALLALACVVIAACSESTSPGPATIQLSAAQAAAISARTQQIAAAVPDLLWLSDSTDFVITSGAQADRIVVTVDGAEKSYYAVGLQRAFLGGNSFATFHLIAFDDASNPVDFVVANGYAPGSGGTAPSSVSGSFGGQSVFAHLLHVTGSSVLDWAAETGTAEFATGTTSGACAALPLPSGFSCFKSTLQAAFTITHVGTAIPEEDHSASLASVTVPGVLLTINTP